MFASLPGGLATHRGSPCIGPPIVEALPDNSMGQPYEQAAKDESLPCEILAHMENSPSGGGRGHPGQYQTGPADCLLLMPAYA